MPSFQLKDNAGNPITNALSNGLAFVVYKDRVGTNRAQPAISHLGSGVYSFTCPAQDLSDGVGYLINCGTGSNPPRGAGFAGDGQVFFAAYDSAGAFLAGLTPTITTYKRADGVNVTPIPAIVGLGSGLYAFTPALADRLAGTRFAIDLGAGAPLSSRYVAGNLGEGFALVSTPTPVAPTNTAGTSTAAPIRRDLAFDFLTGKFFRANGQFVWTSDRVAIAQAVSIRLQTIRGEWFLDIGNGVPWFDAILIKSPNLLAVEQVLRREIETVPGVKSVKTLTPKLDRVKRTLSVVWVADSDLGEINGSDIVQA